MRNEVWSEIGTFLNGLRCGNVKRESYIQLSEVAEAEEQKKEAQKIFLKAMDSMETSKRKSIEDYMEKLKHLAFVEEEQAYCQGYVDCIHSKFFCYEYHGSLPGGADTGALGRD